MGIRDKSFVQYDFVYYLKYFNVCLLFRPQEENKVTFYFSGNLK